MPISNKGTNLRVETNIGGQIYLDEEVREVFYKQNSQTKPRPNADEVPMSMKTFGHPSTTEVEEFVMPPEMEKVIADDLTTKGVSPKPKPKSKPKQTKQPITDKTND